MVKDQTNASTTETPKNHRFAPVDSIPKSIRSEAAPAAIARLASAGTPAAPARPGINVPTSRLAPAICSHPVIKPRDLGLQLARTPRLRASAATGDQGSPDRRMPGASIQAGF